VFSAVRVGLTAGRSLLPVPKSYATTCLTAR
jgi:hypothetical protein